MGKRKAGKPKEGKKKKLTEESASHQGGEEKGKGWSLLEELLSEKAVEFTPKKDAIPECALFVSYLERELLAARGKEGLMETLIKRWSQYFGEDSVYFSPFMDHALLVLSEPHAPCGYDLSENKELIAHMVRGVLRAFGLEPVCWSVYDRYMIVSTNAEEMNEIIFEQFLNIVMGVESLRR